MLTVRQAVVATSIALVSAAAPPATLAQERTITIFAAASLKNALDDINAAFTKKTGIKVVTSYAASSQLMKQIEQGAPADVFASADLDWMDYGLQKKLVQDHTRVNLLGNKLVLIAPKDSKTTLDLKPGSDLAKTLGGGRLAVANVDSVPAGKYGKAALQKLGLWDSVSGSLAQAESVRAALLLVSRGESPLGVVYATDAASDPNVRTVADFPADSHPRIVYPVALTLKAGPAAAGFLDYLKSAKAAPFFKAQGFRVLREK